MNKTELTRKNAEEDMNFLDLKAAAGNDALTAHYRKADASFYEKQGQHQN